MLIFRELNRGKCKTYLVACPRTKRALLIDPLRENISRYLAFLAYHQLTLDAVLDTHTHADHPTGSFQLCELVDARLNAYQIDTEDGRSISGIAFKAMGLKPVGRTGAEK